MDQIADLAPELHLEDALFKGDIKDGYYHLLLRRCDQILLAFNFGGDLLLPCCLKCGLKDTPWFFTKAFAPVVAHL